MKGAMHFHILTSSLPPHTLSRNAADNEKVWLDVVPHLYYI